MSKSTVLVRNLAVVAAISLITAATSQTGLATIISWGTPTTSSATSDVATNGKLLYAYNMGTASDLTVNGVTFAGWAPPETFTSSSSPAGNATLVASTPHSVSGSFTGAGNGGTSGAIGALNTADPNYFTLLDSAAYNYNSGANSLVLTLNNLAIGHKYELELWVDDSRGSVRTDVVSTSGGPSVTLDFSNPSGANNVGQFVIGTFTADDVTQDVTITGAGNNASAQFNAFQLLEVPEPSTMCLLGLGAMVIGWMRRKSR